MLDKEIVELLKEYNEISKDDDWLALKKYVLNAIPSDKRSLFSTRDYYTKKHSINEFEEIIINFYKNSFDIQLKLKEKDKHEKPFWQRKKNER